MKTIVKFCQSYGVYSKGDVAGFETDVASDLIHVKKVAAAYDAPEAEAQTLTIKVDSDEAQAEIARKLEDAATELEARAKARSDELDAREAMLNEREKVIVKDEANLDKYAGELDERNAVLDIRESKLTDPPKSDAGTVKDATAAKPPKQGK